MGRPHADNSQELLHKLFGKFAQVTAQHILDACKRIATENLKAGRRKLRVLDLGPGAVPYASAFADFEHETVAADLSLEIAFLDRDENLPERTIPKWKSQWFKRDVFDIAKKNETPILEACDCRPDRFDLIIVAAALHEFYYDVVANPSGWRVETFHSDFLEWLRGLLESDNSRIIISDYAWAERAKPSHVLRITRAQDLIVRHADPPWAFVSIKRILESASQCGLQVERSNRRGLYDDDSDEQIREVFQSSHLNDEDRLSEAECATVRFRSGYVLTLHPITPQIAAKSEGAQIPNWDLDLIRMGQAVDDLFNRQGQTREEIRTGLHELFVKEETGRGRRLGRFAAKIRMDAESALAPLRLPKVGDLEVWIGIGLKTFDHGRYVPQMELPWVAAVDAKPKLKPSGVLLRENEDAQISEGGPIAIPFWHLLKTPEADPQTGDYVTPPLPTIHNWLVWVNEELHRQGASTASEQTWPLFSRIRSLTVLSPFAMPEDRALMAEWGDIRRQHETGHFLVQLPPVASKEDEYAWTAIGTYLSTSLKRISNLVLPSAGAARFSWLPTQIGHHAVEEGQTLEGDLDRAYSAFLAVVFGLQDLQYLQRALAEVRKSLLSPQLRALFTPLLAEVDLYRIFLEERHQTAPSYRAYTTIALNCDGLTNDQPDSVMLFSGHPIPPAALGRISTYASDLCRPTVIAEANATLKNEGLTQGQLNTIVSLIPSFGHDAKRPARVIRMVLKSGLNQDVKQQAAEILAAELEERLTGHATLLRKPESIAEAKRSEFSLPPLDSAAKIDWVRLEDIWQTALCAVLLGVCIPIDSGGEGLAIHLRGRSLEELVNEYIKPERHQRFERMAKYLSHFSSVVSERCHGIWLPERIVYTAASPHVVQKSACQALRFILTEILTNVFRYEFKDFTSINDRTAEKYELRVELSAETEARGDAIGGKVPSLASIQICAWPGAQPSTRVISRCNGLRSLKLVSGAVGAQLQTQNLQVTSPDLLNQMKSEEVLPYPRWDFALDRLVWRIFDFPVFHEKE